MKGINIFILTLEEEYQHLLSPFCCKSLSDVWGGKRRKRERGRKKSRRPEEGRWKKQMKTDGQKRQVRKDTRKEGAEKRRRGDGRIDGARRWRRAVGDPADISGRVYEM